jgi:hypothetical protein
MNEKMDDSVDNLDDFMDDERWRVRLPAGKGGWRGGELGVRRALQKAVLVWLLLLPGFGAAIATLAAHVHVLLALNPEPTPSWS